MTHFTAEDISALGRIERLTLINSVTGYKPANLVGTASENGKTNLAIISSVVHMGSDPPLIGFFMRPMVTERHTMENILATGCFTINHVHHQIAEKAHFTSADFPREVSEFDRCALTSEFLEGFHAPFVAESKIKIGLELADKLDISLNKTMLVIGKITHLFFAPEVLEQDYHLNLNAAGTICVSGLDTYHSVDVLARYPYARPENTPEF
ncbi:MAG: flavin reductase [Saprospiraceae bacterium]|jgi:flavin reductase (DIM6/NTAB) family NADH-FMN oxidoreductase RutF|nr:flavin reductase [Saprospiraceae bacterium]